MKISNPSFWIKDGLSRILIGLVIFFNLQCALLFLISPSAYASSFELTGFSAQIVISSFGILFIMWNIPYLFALYQPIKYQTSLIQAVLMQTIGFIGESILLLNIPASHNVLRTSIWRFIVFDGLGLVALLIGLFIVRRFSKAVTQEQIQNHKP
jgi:hypothetical protein